MNFIKIFFIFIFSSTLFSQVTGLEGWNICLDPGHSFTENMGAHGYSEAERNLQVALRLRDLLMNTTDIDTVYLTRTTNDSSVSLSQRTDYANTVGAAWFHSIHSDASASPATNRTLLLWGQLRNGNEKDPPGGKAMSHYMVDLLTRGMQIGTSGSWGDWDFYTPWNTPSAGFNGPWLYVNRNTAMPSQLSEAGFHTNPVQNQIFMNDEWKIREAYTYFWTILELFGLERPYAGICTGIVYDMDTREPVNGAVLALDGQSYTTDTFASLFHRFTNNPDLLRNGFYFFDNLAPGTHELITQAEGFYPDTTEITVVDTFFTFQNINLVSNVPPRVLSTTPAEGDTLFPAWESVHIRFSRTMNTESVEAAWIIDPPADGEFSWHEGDRRLRFTPDSLDFLTEYDVTISGTAADIYGHPFDGNSDGTGGDDFLLNFRTGPSDLTPPRLVNLYPPRNRRNVERNLIVNAEFDEELDPLSLFPDIITLKKNSDQAMVSGKYAHYVVNDRSVLSFFPENELDPMESYTVEIFPGYTDLFGNAVTGSRISAFTTSGDSLLITAIDSFEPGFTNFWWGPAQSGSTAGINTMQTGRAEDSTVVNLLTGSTVSHRVDYGWDTTAGDWLIRVYLGSGAARNVTFDPEGILQVYLFGDGSGNRFRFCVDEKVPLSAASFHEVSPWITVDWIGWRLVSWNMPEDGTGSWLGDGVLEGPLRFDSFQMTYTPDSPSSGSFYFDGLRVVHTAPVTSVNENETDKPHEFMLYQNFPNPFNPETWIHYSVAEVQTEVKVEIFDILGKRVRVLVNELQPAGKYSARWDGRDAYGHPVASGNYLYRLSAGANQQIRRMTLVR